MSQIPISFSTKKLLLNALKYISEKEREIEIYRQILSEQYDYNPYQIFLSLDHNKKNKISSEDIILFLKNIGIYETEEVINLLILSYDQDFDKYLNYQEFIPLIQKEKVYQKKILIENDKNENNLSYNINKSLSKIIEKEVELSRKILSYLHDLRNKYDFNIHNLFHLIKGYNCIIDINAIKNFLDDNSCEYLENDLKNILKRLDINKDGKIDFFEFHYFFGYPYCCNCICPLIKCNYCGSSFCDFCFSRYFCIYHNKIHDNLNENNLNEIMKYNKYREIKYNFNEEKIEQKIDNTLRLRLSPERKYAPFEVDFCDKCNNIEYIDRNRLTYKNNSNINDNKSKIEKLDEYINQDSLLYNKDSYNNNYLRKNLKSLFNEYLKLIMKEEKRIEQDKIALSLNLDFNIEDAFRIFEKEGTGILNSEYLKEGFNFFNINISPKEILLFIRRFDLNKKGVINFQEFFDILVPFNTFYRNLVEKRMPLSACPLDAFKVFGRDTLHCIKKILLSIINLENKINEINKNFYVMNFDIKKTYENFDKDKKGYFEFEDLINYLKEEKLIDNYDSLGAKLLFIRFDKKRNGIIEKDEYLNQFSL